MVLIQIAKQLFKTFFYQFIQDSNYVSAHLSTQGIFFTKLFIFISIYSFFQFLFIYLLGGTGVWIQGFVLAADCEVIEGNI
jgi:hypothetical protein